MDTPIILILQVASCLLLSGMLLLQRNYFHLYTRGVAAHVLPFLIFAFPMARAFLLEPLGVSLGETLSIAAFVSAIMFLLHAIQSRRWFYGVYSGFAFALAAYVRSQYEPLLISLTVSAVPLVIWQIISRARALTIEAKSHAAVIIKCVLVSLLIAHTLMVPWRVHNYIEGGSLSWTQTFDLVEKVNSLSSEKTLLERNGKFVIDGGGNLACVVEPAYCDSNDSSLFFKAFVGHFKEWCKLKAPYLKDFWFESVNDVFSPNEEVRRAELKYNVLLLCFMAGIAPLLLMTRRCSAWPILLWANLSVLGTYLIIFTLVHLEVRYFFFVKLWACTMFIILASIARSQSVLRGNPEF